jgi:integrase
MQTTKFYPSVWNGARIRRSQVPLSGFAESLIREMSDSSRKSTAKSCRSTINSLTAFTGNENLLIEEITSTLMCRYEDRLLDEGLHKNTVSFYMRNLRAIRNKAINRGIMSPSFENPFAGVHTGIYETKKRALTGDELRRLTRLSSQESLSPAENRALLYFLFGFHACGMSFIDLAFLKKSDISDDHIHYFRKKTRQSISVMITAPMKKILEYFSGMVVGSTYLFPLIDPRKGDERKQYESALRVQNRHLKKLGKLAGIEKSISTHVSRHSWATIAREEDFPVSVISECLGHRDEKTTAIYLNSFAIEVRDRASKRISAVIANPVISKPAFRTKTGREDTPDCQSYNGERVRPKKMSVSS